MCPENPNQLGRQIGGYWGSKGAIKSSQLFHSFSSILVCCCVHLHQNSAICLSPFRTRVTFSWKVNNVFQWLLGNCLLDQFREAPLHLTERRLTHSMQTSQRGGNESGSSLGTFNGAENWKLEPSLEMHVGNHVLAKLLTAFVFQTLKILKNMKQFKILWVNVGCTKWNDLTKSGRFGRTSGHVRAGSVS